MPEEYEPLPETYERQTPSNTVATVAPREMKLVGKGGTTAEMSVEDLKQLSFEDAANLLGVSEASEELGQDQFGPILEDKGKLVGVPFLALHWVMNPNGEFGPFVTVFVMTHNSDRYIINDGSFKSGICQQLAALTEATGQTSGLLCRRGLRASTYEAELPNGKKTMATTYYIDAKLVAEK